MTTSPTRPKGGIEQARRDLMRDDRELYDYIEARVAARELKRAGDDASGAVDGYGAANRVWALAARWERKWKGMALPEHYPAVPSEVAQP
jgi:hypothetical protein